MQTYQRVNDRSHDHLENSLTVLFSCADRDSIHVIGTFPHHRMKRSREIIVNKSDHQQIEVNQMIQFPILPKFPFSQKSTPNQRSFETFIISIFSVRSPWGNTDISLICQIVQQTRYCLFIKFAETSQFILEMSC